MRLIDADKFKSWLDVGHLRSPTEMCLSELHVERMIDLQPTVDAVEVVRCKDCIHCTPVEGGLPLCTRYNTAVFYSDFCSCGERSCNSDV